MIIDIHGHFTTTPPQVAQFRQHQIERFVQDGMVLDQPPEVTDAEIRAAIEPHQLARMKERGVDVTLFSPRAVGMDHHQGNVATNVVWARYCNDLVHRVCQMYPQQFVGVAMLPQAAGVRPVGAVLDELKRCINDLGFVGVNLNPDPTGGHWSDPPLWDRDWWYPLYEQLVELNIPAMIHVSGSCNPHFNAVATHYINGDTTAFVQFLTSDVFRDFPDLKFVLPHGGGAVPYHWGRYRGIAQDMGLPELEDKVLNNVYFDTCVYHQPGIDLLLSVLPSRNVLFASETFGAVNGIDPRSGHHYDHTRRYIDDSASTNDADRSRIYQDNALGVYPRLRPLICSVGA
jgi:4-oxalmesaconate hydratase